MASHQRETIWQTVRSRTRYCVLLSQLLTAVWTLEAYADPASAQEFDANWETEREGQFSDRFVWGATQENGASRFGGPVDRLQPWHPGQRLRRGDTGEWGRHVGKGDPLMGTSWQNRPFQVGWLFGSLVGDDLTRGQVTQEEDVIGGYRLGWDFDHYWGTEGRFAFSNVDFIDESAPSSTRNADHRFWDVNLLYYPWGDSRWRPFASVGMGWGAFSYTLADGRAIDKTLFALPIGGGVKYYFQRWMALRFTATDNWTIGQGPINTMHSLSLTADIEIRFGGRRTSYFPYGGSIHQW